MKKFVVAAILTAFSLPALAADLRVPPPAYKAPLAVPLLDPWTGWYVGAHIGYGWNSENNAAAFEFIPIGTLVNTPQGVLGGFQGGYGMRIASFLYGGIEVDGTAADLTVTSSMPGLITMSSKNTWMASIRPEVGVIVGNAVLFGTAGWGWGGGEFTINDFSTGTQLANTSTTRNGLVWGGGIKFALSPQWILGVKYLQYDLGSFNTTLAPDIVVNTKQRVDAVRLELNYHLGAQ